jgi:hypothetical protein
VAKRAWVIGALWLAVVVMGCGAIGGLERPSPRLARIVMTESGGIAGMVNVLTVEPGLTVTYQTRQGVSSGRLTAEQMADLVNEFYEQGFFALQDDYRPTPMIADGITTIIAYSDSQRSKTVITGTNAREPDSLQRIVRAVKGTIGSAR